VSTTNQALIEKAAMDVAQLAAGGYLNPMQSDKFIRGIIDQPTIIKEARTETIIGETAKIEKIGFGSRIMRAGVENTPLGSDQYARPTYGTVNIHTKEVIAEVRISYDTLEANIERGNLRQTLITLIQERCALDLEELILQGDTESLDAYLAVLDGLLKKCTGHVVSNGGEVPYLGGWSNLIRAVPQKYIRDILAWRIYTSRNVDLAWKEQIAARNTVAGDRFLLQNTNATALGFIIQPIALMPENLVYDPTPATPDSGDETAATYGQALLTHPKNMIVGFTRKVQMEMDKDISARQYIFVVTLKVDTTWEETDACALLQYINPAVSSAPA